MASFWDQSRISKADISTHVGSLRLSSCIYNASGVRCTTRDDLLELQMSCAGAVLTKSCTRLPREGNEPPKYHYDSESVTSVNSNGLTNEGCQFYQDAAKWITEKPYIVSMSTLGQYLETLQQLSCTPGVDALEINASCPNVDGAACELSAVIDNVQSCVPRDMVWGLKLPPYFHDSEWRTVAACVGNSRASFVVCCNSLPNGLLVDWESETACIKPNGGLGGVGGAAMKATTLANVYRLRQLLPEHISVIGCGGVFRGQDVFELLLAGASAVQVGTCLQQEGTDCLDRISRELKEIMAAKGYHYINDFQGKIKCLL